MLIFVIAAVPMTITGAIALHSARMWVSKYANRTLGGLGRDFSWALTSNVIYYACQWSLVVVLAKVGTPADLGAYALGLAVTVPIVFFTSFQQRNLVAADVRDEYTFGEYIAFRIASMAGALLVVGIIAVFTQHTVSNIVIIMLIGLAQSLEFVSETYFGLLQKHGRMDKVSLSLMLKGPLGLFSLWLVMWLTHNVLLAAFALVLARSAVLVFFDVPSARLTCGPHTLKWNLRTQGRLLVTAFPLGVITGLGGLNLNIPRYFIEYFLSRRELGIFSALASLIGAGNLVMAALASCIIVKLAKAWVMQDRRIYQSLFFRFLTVSAIVGSGGVLLAFTCGSTLLTLLFRPEYAHNTGILARVMAAGAIGYVVCVQGYTLTAARKLLVQIPPLAASGAVTSLCCWVFVPRRGLEGAAEAWIVGAFFLLICNAALLAYIKEDRPVPWNATTLSPVMEKK